MAVVRTPGGRIGNDRRTGSRSNGENWVERTSSGSLPRYIRIVRNGLMREGHSEGRATALAVASIRRWALGRGNVSPKVRAAAKVALAQWEKMKREKGYDPSTNEDLNPDTWGQSKGVDVKIEHKNVGVSGIKMIGDEDDGIIEAFVSITGVRDRVGDIIEPGSYEKTLNDRLPKGIWSHDWNQPIAKTLEAKELMPGDPGLPKTLPDGSPWPAEAGALKVKMQFNLTEQRGRQAYSDVKFFGTDQEWSIGYNVPSGMATMSTKGVTKTRNIKGLDLYEYSPVLWGAMPFARSSDLKTAQETHMAFKSILGEDYMVEHDMEELTTFLEESKAFFEASIETKGMVVDPDEEDDDDDWDDDEGEKTLVLQEKDMQLLRDAGDLINQILNGEYKGLELPEEKDDEFDIEGKTLGDVFDTMEYKGLGDEGFADMENVVILFDEAIESGDVKSIEEAAESVLDTIESKQDGQDPECAEELKNLASALSAILEDFEAKNDESWDEADSKPAENYQDDEEDNEEYVEDDGKGEKMVTIDTDTLGTELKDLQQWINSI